MGNLSHVGKQYQSGPTNDCRIFSFLVTGIWEEVMNLKQEKGLRMSGDGDASVVNCEEVPLPEDNVLTLIKTITDRHEQEIGTLHKQMKKLDENNRALAIELEEVRILCRKGWLSFINLPMNNNTDLVACIAELFRRIPIHSNECVPNDDVISIDWCHLRDRRFGVLHVLLRNRSYNAMLSMAVQKRIKEYNNRMKGANPLNIAVVHSRNQQQLYYLAQQMKKMMIEEQRLKKLEDVNYTGDLIKINRFITFGSELTVGKEKISLEAACKARNITWDELSKLASDARAKLALNEVDTRKRKNDTVTGPDYVKMHARRGRGFLRGGSSHRGGNWTRGRNAPSSSNEGL